MKKIASTVATALAAAFAAPSSAGVILTFGFTELNGTYTATGADSGIFTAVAANNGDLASEGDVTRLLAPGDGTAEFEEGWISHVVAGLADVRFNMTRTGATGSGTYVITDVDGDTISGSLSGEWLFLGGATMFNGVIDGAFTTSGAGTVFNGPSVPSTVFNHIVGPMDGGITFLFTNANSDFFGSSFTNVSTLVQANYVPAPGLFGIGAACVSIAAGRRRSRTDVDR